MSGKVDRGPVTRFKYGSVVRRGGVLEETGDVWVCEGRVVDPQRLFYEERRSADVVVDCRRLIVAPGFIDLQINGAFGVDFSSPEGDFKTGLDKVASGLLQHGVTAFCPTLVTAPAELYHQVLPELRATSGSKSRAAILGAHCEGPFISQEKRGAHQEAFISSSPSPPSLRHCYGCLDNVRIITLAPELPGAMATIRWLSEEKNVTVSLGHSVATLSCAEEAVGEGASFVTHLFNAMLPFHHRDPGIVGLLTTQSYGTRPLHYGLIADGNHTHETVARIAYKANPGGVVLVTDAMAAMGLGDGVHSLGTMRVCVKEGVAKLYGSSTLAGSVTSMPYCVKEFMRATACSPAEALRAASLHPALTLGLDKRKGSFVPGADADIVLLDENLNVQATYVGGECAWSRTGPVSALELDES